MGLVICRACRCWFTRALFRICLLLPCPRPPVQVRYADFATLTTLLHYEKKIDAPTSHGVAAGAGAGGGKGAGAMGVGSGVGRGVFASEGRPPSNNGAQNEGSGEEEHWWSDERELYKKKQKQLVDTRKMLTCVLGQLRDVDQSQTIAGVPITWNVLKAAAGAIGSVAAVAPRGGGGM
jgi:hypothetical protein